MSLTAPERETVITMDDSGEFAIISTFQRPILTKLKRNRGAELIRDTSFDGTAGGMFRIPANLISFRNPRGKREMTEAQREAQVQRGRRLGESRRNK